MTSIVRDMFFEDIVYNGQLKQYKFCKYDQQFLPLVSASANCIPTEKKTSQTPIVCYANSYIALHPCTPVMMWYIIADDGNRLHWVCNKFE